MIVFKISFGEKYVNGKVKFILRSVIMDWHDYCIYYKVKTL